MKRFKILNLIVCAIFLLANDLFAQNGFYDAPYVRYEADAGALANGAAATTRSYNQWDLQSEASEQVCVNLPNTNSSVQWTVSADGDGLVVRYCVPDGQTGILEVYANGTYVTDLTLTTYYSWESLWNNGNSNNAGVSNQAPKMRFDEVRYKLPSRILTGGTLKLVRKTGSANIYIDFAELEPVPAQVNSSAGNLVYGGNGSDLQTVIDNNGGATIYLPPGVYNVNRELYFGSNNTVLKGAGMWYTEIHFTNGNGNQGGLRSNAYNVSYSGLYLTTVRNSRSNSYKAINGAYTSGSTITNVWAEHFECGAWIADYNAGGPTQTDGLRMSYCRFRNNYADGSNLCRGTLNTIVEHCSYRNNGDDDMGIWSADGWECQNNTFRYNTSENTWRSAGCAIYGGYNNKGQNLLIRDNLEVGIKVNNAFAGAGFNGGGMHELTNITIMRCGTNYDLFNKPVGAIELGSYDWGAGTRVQNVKFSCIQIIDSKNDAISFTKVINTSDGFYNIIFENITIDGTGREYPDNGGTGTARGFGLIFKGGPAGYGTYCGMSYTNRGGNASSDVNTSGIGSFSWSQAGTCPGGCVTPTSTTITSASTFGICNDPITLTATTSALSGNTVSYIEFFVDGSTIGQDNSSPYSVLWNNAVIGEHQVKAVAHYAPSGTTSTSSIQNVVVADGIYPTTTAPAIDGSIDAVWSKYSNFTLNKIPVGTVSSAADLSATFKITRDATNLYILVNVTDDDLRNDGGNTYDNDGVELFIDMGNDKAGAYGANDFAYSFVWNDATVYESKHNATTNVVFKQGTKTGGYIMEIKIPWATLGGAQATGTFIGFDLHVNDDDGGGTRDAKKTWNDDTDNAWQWPSELGTLQIAGCDNPLPVELTSFTGELNNGSVVLSWSTAKEINNDKFIVERSANSIDWVSIGEVKGIGNSTSTTNYSYTDNIPVSGNNYYRLQQVDVNGNIIYSNVILVKSNGPLSITPNPFNDDLIIHIDEALTIEGSISGNIDITIYDVLGKLMNHYNQKIYNNTLRIHPQLPSGTYLVTIQTESFIEQRKVIKK